MYLPIVCKQENRLIKEYNNYYITCICQVPKFHRGAGDLKKKKHFHFATWVCQKEKKIFIPREKKYSTNLNG